MNAVVIISVNAAQLNAGRLFPEAEHICKVHVLFTVDWERWRFHVDLVMNDALPRHENFFLKVVFFNEFKK